MEKPYLLYANYSENFSGWWKNPTYYMLTILKVSVGDSIYLLHQDILPYQKNIDVSEPGDQEYVIDKSNIESNNLLTFG